MPGRTAGRRYGGGVKRIELSFASLLEGSAQGTVIGTLSVRDATTAYTFSLTDSASNKAQLSGSSLQAGSSAASAGTFNVSVHADDGAGSVLDATFAITVDSVSAGSDGTLDFSLDTGDNTGLLTTI